MPAEPAAAHAAEKPPLTSDYLDCAQLRFSLGCTTVADKAPLKAQVRARAAQRPHGPSPPPSWPPRHGRALASRPRRLSAAPRLTSLSEET